jgi:hypothetical protein
MPRYFFHTADGSVSRDRTGTELPDAGSAKTMAVKFASQCLANQPDQVWQNHQFRVDVTDEQERTVFTMILVAIDGPEYFKNAK